MKFKRMRLLVVTLFTLLTASLYPYSAAAGEVGNITYEYDSNGRLKTATYNSGMRVTYLYDQNGNLIQRKLTLIPIGYLDIPIANADYLSNEGVEVKGWFLNEGGNSRVEIYDNNTLIDTITTFVEREDVYNAYPKYNLHNAGFDKSYTFSKGTHVLKVIGIGKNGEQTVLTRSFTVSLPTIGALESPLDNETFNSIFLPKKDDYDLPTIFVSGWFLNDQGFSKIDFYLNNELVTTLSAQSIVYFKKERQDIFELHPEYGEVNSGFLYPIGVTEAGSQQLKVVFTGLDGKQLTFTRFFFVKSGSWIEVPEPPAM
ncbi:RHS repeat domain-containing protein [Paenibacillus caui]|uniref:RHS repeat domain-containing protein n=1 Tax=Paenibacillus caui TaxID=2873927 RepID=UPI001CAA10B6|nr:RHS repeat domain-containing protein [Paenibacillus caui]